MSTKGKGKTYAWLLAHVDYRGKDCLPWPFCKDNRVGRGKLGYDGARWWAHRLMCVLAHGKPPTSKHQAAHNCGKGHFGCVNPRHLEWKTNSQNQIDRRKTGSMLRNRNGNKTVLTDAQVAEIISLKEKMTQVSIAAKFGVSLGCVQYWLKYRSDRGHTEGKVRHWTPDQELALKAGIAGGIAATKLSAIIGKSLAALSMKAKRLGLVTNSERG